MYSEVCRDRVLKRLQKPSGDGVKTTFGGYEIESGPDFIVVRKIHSSGAIVMTA